MKTFVIIKPDAVARGFIGEIISRFERCGFRISHIERRHKNLEWCRAHYADIWDLYGHSEIYTDLRISMTGSSLIGIVLVGDNIIRLIRKMIGDTNCLVAVPGTIRGDLGKYDGCRNLVHAADSVKAVNREIKLFFDKETDQ